MKTLLFLLALGFVGTLEATPSRLVMDGGGQRVEFPRCAINGVFEWSQSVCAFYTGLGTGTVVAVTPLAFEVNLSTILIVNRGGRTLLGFENYSEWISCQTRTGLENKIREFRTLSNSMSDLPAAVSREIQERWGWLRSYYNSLP